MRRSILACCCAALLAACGGGGGGGGSSTPVDAPPVAVADTVDVAEGSGAMTIAVLANDTDPDGGPRRVSAVTPPAHGTAALAADTLSVTYSPAAGYCNEAPNAPRDTFTYTLSPGGSTATVSVRVTCACGAHRATEFVVGSQP